MARFIYKVLFYLAVCVLFTSGIIYLGIVLKPAYFLGAPTDYVLARYQYSKAASPSPFTNIIIGDSRGNSDIDPRILGNNWLNLAIPGSEATEGYFTLKHFLRNNKVDTLIMFYGYEGLSEGITYFEERTIPWRFPTKCEVRSFEEVETSIDQNIHGNSSVSRIKLLFKQAKRHLKYMHFPLAFQKTFVDGVMQLTEPSTITKTTVVLNTVKGSYGHINFGKSDSCSTISLENLDQPFKPKPIQFTYLDSVLYLAAQHQIHVYLVIPPLNQATYNVFKNSNYYKTAIPHFKQVIDKHPALQLISEPASLPNSLFGDALHLHKKGTVIYSEYLKRILRNKKD
jgi:hypothetical protein